MSVRIARIFSQSLALGKTYRHPPRIDPEKFDVSEAASAILG